MFSCFGVRKHQQLKYLIGTYFAVSDSCPFRYKSCLTQNIEIVYILMGMTLSRTCHIDYNSQLKFTCATDDSAICCNQF